MAVELYWIGQSGFRLRDPASGATVFCDPFISSHPDRTWPSPVGPDDVAAADLVLVSHEHIDHLDRPALEAAAHARGSQFTLVVPRPIARSALDDFGLPTERVIGAQPGEPVERHGVRVQPVPARHGVNVSDAYNFGEQLSEGLVRYLGYVVEIGGVRAYHAGDCIPYDGQADRLRSLRPYVALLPINGRDVFRETEANIVGNMDFREAARLACDIGAEVLVPMHWELFSHNRGFPGDLLHYAAERYPRLTVLVMGRGARVSLAPTTEA